jgi:hypothetical protein
MPRVRTFEPNDELNDLASCNLLGRVQYAIRLVQLGADRCEVLHELYQIEKFVGVPGPDRRLRNSQGWTDFGVWRG